MKTSKVAVVCLSFIIALYIMIRLGRHCRPEGDSPNRDTVGTTRPIYEGQGPRIRTNLRLTKEPEDELDMRGSDSETFDRSRGPSSLPLDLMQCDNCFRWRYPLRLQPREDLCRPDGGGGFEVIDLLILCNTKHTNTEQRKVLREIYNQHNIKGGKVRLMFLFGDDPGGSKRLEEELLQESKTHGDILQTVVNGTYHNLTLLVFNGYQWAVDNCPRARFTAKISDDHLMNINGVLDLLDQFGDTELHDVVIGWCYMKKFPFRNKKNKMYMNYKMYPFAILPNFCAGACLLVSLTTVREILKEAGNMAYPTMMDDGNIGMIIKFTGHQTCHVPNVEIKVHTALKKLFSKKSKIETHEICAAVDWKRPTLGIHLHGYKPQTMKTIWKNCGNFKQHLTEGSLHISCPRRKMPYVKTVRGNRWIQNQNI